MTDSDQETAQAKLETTVETAQGRAEEAGTIVVGVLSDTHGHLYPEVKELLEGVDHIIHAGDVGSAQVLAALRALAPLTVVRGNCDFENWASSLPAEAEVEIGGVRILVGHLSGRLRGTLARDSRKHGAIRVAVSGHTHRAASEERDGVLYLNPGSAGQGRFGRPRTMARLTITPPVQAQAPARIDVDFVALS